MRSTLLLLAGCASAAAPRPAPPPAGPPILWNSGNGWTTLTIEASGVATYDFHPTGRGADPSSAVTKHLTLTAAELADLERMLTAHHPCAIHPTGRSPVPEEGEQSLALALPGASCTARMLSNDWSTGDDPRAIAGALDALAERVRTQGQ